MRLFSSFPLKDGDISATNPTEFKVAIVLVLIASCLWAYIIGSACGIISNLDVATINHHQTLDQLNFFIKEYGQAFSQPMKEQLREFFHHSSNLRRTEECEVSSSSSLLFFHFSLFFVSHFPQTTRI